MSKNMNVPKLRFKEFDGEWENKKFGDVYDFFQTNSFSRALLNYDSGNVRNIHYGDIHTKFKSNFYLDKEEVPYINVDVDISKIKDENYCQEKDIIIADASEDYKDIGKTIEIIKLDNKKLLAGLHTYIARDAKDKMALGFGGYFMQTHNVRLQMMKLATGISVLGISKGNLSKMNLVLPSKQEQEKIASFLTSVYTKIEQLTRKEELLQQYKKGVMQKIFSQEIRFKADDGSEFCDWEEKKFEDYLEMPINLKPKNAEKNKLLTVKLHQKGIYKSENTDSLSMGATYYIREKGQFIYGKQNLFNGAFGIIPQEFDNYLTSTDVPTLNFKINRINPNYFLFFIGRKEYYTKLEIFASGTGSKRIHEKTLLDFKAFFPCLEEQTKIANFLSSIDSKIEQVQKQLNYTKEFKKALLQQMFV